MVRKFFEDDSGDIDLIERNDADTGEVVYKMADNGTLNKCMQMPCVYVMSQSLKVSRCLSMVLGRCVFILADVDFGIWTGGLTYPKEGVALLAAVVTGGFHPVSTYEWSMDDIPYKEEQYPIIYATARGTYVCAISTKCKNEIQVTNKMTFTIGGNFYNALTRFA